MKISCFVVILLAGFIKLNAQNIVNISVVPDHKDWNYKIGEKVKFTISVYKFMSLLNDVEITYKVGKERMPASVAKTEFLKNGTITIEAASLPEPGFLTCEVSLNYEGKEFKDWSSAAFEPEKIKPTATLPADFRQFWDSTKMVLSKVPLETKMVLVPELCTDKVNVYDVNFRNIKGRVYGYVCIPSKPGKYPAILYAPWAGVYAAVPEISAAEKGFITFSFNIHGIPNTLNKQAYTDLGDGALKNYPFINLDNREDYYYNRVYMAGVRANDFLTSLTEYDGSNLGVIGLSQGGGLSIIVAALDKRVKYLSVTYPALCDLTGYLLNRAGGWPHLFKTELSNKKDKIETSRYYDAVNFARFITVPGIYTWGYNDATCPPTSMFSAYNVITATKELHIYQDRKHESYAEQREIAINWLMERLKVK